MSLKLLAIKQVIEDISSIKENALQDRIDKILDEPLISDEGRSQVTYAIRNYFREIKTKTDNAVLWLTALQEEFNNTK